MKTAMEATFERSEAEAADEGGCEADGSLMNSVSIRVEYYRSFEYQLEWPAMLNTRRLKKTQRDKNCKSPTPVQEIRHWPLNNYGRKKTQKQTVNSDEGGASDLINLIDRDHEPLRSEEEPPADDGVTQSDKDCWSSSFASGLSRTYQDTSQNMCSSCLKVYKRAKKMKTTTDKLLDNDPLSLSCDQWVLLKKRSVRCQQNTKGKLLRHVFRITTRLRNQRSPEPNKYYLESDCSRPHAFLQRNLRGKPKPHFKEQRNKRKRSRQTCQGPRSSKQRCLHDNNRQPHQSDVNSTQSNHTLNSSSTSFWDGDGSPEPTEEPASAWVFNPSNVTMPTSRPRDSLGKSKKPKKQAGFRNLLAQLSMNSSTIIRENI